MATEESFLDLGVNLDDVPEISTVPGGEYQLQIADLGITETEKGKFLIPKFKVVGVPNSKTVSHPMRIPDNSMDADEKDRRHRAIKHFYKAFDINREGPVSFAEHIGKTGYAVLDESEDPKYGKQNNVRSYTANR